MVTSLGVILASFCLIQLVSMIAMVHRINKLEEENKRLRDRSKHLERAIARAYEENPDKVIEAMKVHAMSEVASRIVDWVDRSMS